MKLVEKIRFFFCDHNYEWKNSTKSWDYNKGVFKYKVTYECKKCKKQKTITT